MARRKKEEGLAEKLQFKRQSRGVMGGVVARNML